MMNEYKPNLIWIYIPALMLVVAELFILNGTIIFAIYIHMLNFLVTILIITFINSNLDVRKTLQGFTLLIMLRIINLSIPKFFALPLIQYSLIYGIMFIPIYYTIKDYTAKDLNMTFKNITVYIPMGILIGSIIAIEEHKIINNEALISILNFSNIFLIIIIMFLFIAVVEEILFRLILQTRLNIIFGFRKGILASGIFFGIMHSEYGQINEILFSSIIGIIIGYIFYRTRSLPLTITIHGTTNVVLFGILPLLNK